MKNIEATVNGAQDFSIKRGDTFTKVIFQLSLGDNSNLVLHDRDKINLVLGTQVELNETPSIPTCILPGMIEDVTGQVSVVFTKEATKQLKAGTYLGELHIERLSSNSDVNPSVAIAPSVGFFEVTITQAFDINFPDLTPLIENK